MKPFDYSDEKISQRELGFAIPSVVIGVSVLTAPRLLAQATKFADGWLCILFGGLIALLFTWLTAKLAARFPNQSFFEYSSMLVSKPVAFLVTLFLVFYLIIFTSYEIRYIATISKQYLFDRTPAEVIGFAFLLVVTYAVTGSRAALFRLNVLFLPIIIAVLFVVLLATIPLFDWKHLFPLFKTDLKGYINGTKVGFFSYSGWVILLFYTGLMTNPDKAPKVTAAGMIVPMVVYTLLYMTTIGVFSNIVTRNLVFPTIEMAKEVKIPGGIFERVETLFFTVWIMAIFSTVTLLFDASIMALNSIFKKVKKQTIIFILVPIVYLISMLPKSLIQLVKFGDVLDFLYPIAEILIPFILFFIAYLRRKKGHG
ncbi:spore germination protein [Scopulibacillus darangshiensis]|uniref:Spore germination protein n=1 Tax=Scopulibacillus darangshiensis TaxID=442528 RepID=A0A4R2NGR7_9BACL|nr:endospore germination permease [Scopulibacillus darangshiensis]TCP20304.1 spore germination protein [Scopulibacillus darangshiensis]